MFTDHFWPQLFAILTTDPSSVFTEAGIANVISNSGGSCDMCQPIAAWKSRSPTQLTIVVATQT